MTQPSRRQFLIFFVLPTLGLLLLTVRPLVTGEGTLVYRDVMSTHRPLVESLAQGLESGRVPLLDSHRGGGQALVGNPNAVALYPTTLLHAVARPLWVLNAHFWVHWLLAPLAGFWMGRAFGLGRVGAWMVGVAWATSGFFMSQMNLMNLVAGATWAPALVAASVQVGAGRVRSAAWVGLLWAAMLLGGDPIFAVLALGAALLAVAPGLVDEWRSASSRQGRGLWRSTLVLRSGALTLALGAGFLLAAPLLLEMMRILPTSFRGHWQSSLGAVLSQSWDPRSALEMVLPLVFGGADLGFWGFDVYGGNPPLFHSLAPGPLVIALAIGGLGAGPRRRARTWAIVVISLGLFLALGGFNPFVRASLALPGTSALRYPVKAWLLVALGLALLSGLGIQRVVQGRRRLVLAAFGGLALLYGVAWFVALRAGAKLVEAIVEGGRALPRFVAQEPSRWAATALTCLMVVLVAGALLVLERRWKVASVAALCGLQTLGQLLLLGPLLEMDAVDPYEASTPLRAAVSPENLVFHGGLGGFGSRTGGGGLAAQLPDARMSWLSRLHALQLYPMSGVAQGLSYALNPSTEGLDTFYVTAVAQALPRLPDDAHRIRLLGSSGVDRLILARPLDASVELGRPLAEVPGPVGSTFVWELPASPPVRLATTIRRAPHIAAALGLLAGSELDRGSGVVLAGATSADEERPRGVATLLGHGEEWIDLEVRSEQGGVVVIRRAWTPHWKARIDGLASPTVVANATLLGVEVPAGVRRVRLDVDRGLFRLGVVLAALGGLLLLVLAVPPARWRRRVAR